MICKVYQPPEVEATGRKAIGRWQEDEFTDRMARSLACRPLLLSPLIASRLIASPLIFHLGPRRGFFFFSFLRGGHKGREGVVSFDQLESSHRNPLLL